MAASLDPVVEQPMADAASGACHRSARMCTQRDSISAVCGYSSLSIMFLSMQARINRSTSGATRVVQNVARFWRELPSSSSSSCTSASAIAGGTPRSGIVYFGRRPFRKAGGVHRRGSDVAAATIGSMQGHGYDPVFL